jgi:pimeloyl-ACP methyl ester carboxylesterase
MRRPRTRVQDPLLDSLLSASSPFRAVSIFIATFKLMAGVGHYPMLEAPEEFNRLLQETLDELKR